jgi:Fe(3+) dicitrate transport protein
MDKINMFIRKNLTITVGLRGGFYHYSRNIFRSSSKDTIIQNDQFTAGFITGAGINCRVGKSADLFAGVNRGFAPPGSKDAISNHGEVYRPRLKTAGIMNQVRGLQREIFMRQKLPVSDRAIPVCQSSAGSGKLFKSENRILNPDVNFTFTDSRFSADRRIISETDTVNIRQNFTPYASRVLLNPP